MVYTAGQLHAMREIVGFNANFVNSKQGSSWRLFDPKALNVNTQVLLLDPHGIKELLHDFKYTHIETQIQNLLASKNKYAAEQLIKLDRILPLRVPHDQIKKCYVKVGPFRSLKGYARMWAEAGYPQLEAAALEYAMIQRIHTNPLLRQRLIESYPKKIQYKAPKGEEADGVVISNVLMRIRERCIAFDDTENMRQARYTEAIKTLSQYDTKQKKLELQQSKPANTELQQSKTKFHPDGVHIAVKNIIEKSRHIKQPAHTSSWGWFKSIFTGR